MQIVFDNVTTTEGLQDFSLALETTGCTVIYDPHEQISRYILSALVGLEEVEKGTLLINGKTYPDFIAQAPLLATFGYVFDEGIMLANLSLRENLLLPWRKRFEGKSDSGFQQSLNLWLERLELSIDLNLRPAHVSPAVRKQLGYVRSFMLKPQLMLIDDPYYLFNKLEREQILRFLHSVKPQQKMLIASADDDFIGEIASRIVDLSGVCQ